MNNLLDTAINIAVDTHSGQVDKAGLPYIFHPLRVMMALENDKDRIVGVLHDTIEDTNVTYDYLSEKGFDNEILDAIKSVSRNENETYPEFINRASLNPIGRRVKLADLEDNMNISRIANPTENDYKRLEKYKKAKDILMNATTVKMDETKIYKDKNSDMILDKDYILLEGVKVCEALRCEDGTLLFEELKWNYDNGKIELKDEPNYPDSYDSEEIEIISYNKAVKLLRN